MADIILLCGKVCSGKTHYANNIKQRYNAVILSCDELMLDLFEEQLGSKHNVTLNKVKQYLYQLADQIVLTDTYVILDFGFWTLSERQHIKQYYAERGITTELHYVSVQPEVWMYNMEQRNRSLHHAKVKSYFIDENMIQLFSDAFEEPDRDEIDVLVDNSWLKQ